MRQPWASIWLAILSVQLICAHPADPVSPPTDSELTEFIILHTNDMHARFEETNKYGYACSQADSSAGKCVGGFARIAHLIKKHREEAQNGGAAVLYLNAGDTFSGTMWFSIFKSAIASTFLNKLQPNAISLGNHEFDINIPGLVSFLEAVQFPVLVCNMDYSAQPELLAVDKLRNSTVLDVNGAKVGVIGYLTPKTKEDYVNKVEFNDEITSINAEAARLKELGIKIIIALGHSGYQKDQEIAKECPDVDIVIGGHSHTYLDASKPIADKEDTNPEAVRGPYPTTVVQPSGKKVPVVQAYTNAKYMGKLKVQFDAEGNLVQFGGAPILLNVSVPQDPEILELLDTYRPNITAQDQHIVGHTQVELEGGNVCRLRECNLGNLVTDSMVYARMLENKGGEYWTDAAVAFIAGGGIRTSIKRRTDGSITFRDIAEVLAFKNNLHVTRISGRTLLNALEHSASRRRTDSNGGFQQFSGLRVEYDFDMEEGQQVKSVLVRCADCKIPSYRPLHERAFYKVIVPSFLLNGGDAFKFIEEHEPLTDMLKLDDKAALQQYLEAHPIVYPAVEGRITIQKSKLDR